MMSIMENGGHIKIKNVSIISRCTTKSKTHYNGFFKSDIRQVLNGIVLLLHEFPLYGNIKCVYCFRLRSVASGLLYCCLPGYVKTYNQAYTSTRETTLLSARILY